MLKVFVVILGLIRITEVRVSFASMVFGIYKVFITQNSNEEADEILNENN